MKKLGSLLRQLRNDWGLSLSEVERRTATLALRWGSDRYVISKGHLAKLERGWHEMRVATLLSLSHTYSEPVERLVDASLPELYHSTSLDRSDGPNSTLLIRGGRLLETAERLLPSGHTERPTPESTTLIATGLLDPQNRFRKAIVGTKDRTLYPFIRPGAIITVDTHQRRIASHREWTNEFDRPIYLLHTSAGYVCGWCQVGKDDSSIHVVSHLLSQLDGPPKLDVLPLIHGKNVEVVGRVTEVVLRLVP
jgi:transcriptional regulator with XRE-family HTH domain